MTEQDLTLRQMKTRLYALAIPKFKDRYFVPIPKKVEVHTNYKLSVCTVCMDRTSQLKTTYIKNIEECGYDNVEFVLLNYNSKDDMDNWVYDNLGTYLNNGKVVYYKTTEPRWFNNSHSRNVAWRLATGDFITNLDADFFLHPTFLTKLNELANIQSRNVVFIRGHSRIRGIIAFHTLDFDKLHGFDENLKDYSPWDRDIYNRAVCSGFGILSLGTVYGDIPSRHWENHPARSSNYKYKRMGTASQLNMIRSLLNILTDDFAPNREGLWGKASLSKNFTESITI